MENQIRSIILKLNGEIREIGENETIIREEKEKQLTARNKAIQSLREAIGHLSILQEGI